ncbi:hypothetical protein GOBAR_AA18050 [Gossypium barbadense]|uniref:Pentacotripeptide-repeat region of PRORP domain-containing protein n=1 Tax=Gossypium barbadense TaxID=3634 RepID=A0A2P5XGY0_GOSBA|nr:hypothetical protein GOBAR_AA18050 [Gossypium barbadense]
MKLVIGSNLWTYSCISRILRVVAYSTNTLSPNASPSKPPYTLPIPSIVPVLNQWLKEGKAIKHSMLQTIIRHLCSFGRFKQALEVSEFMSEEMRYGISVGDMAVRLDLILKVHGVEQAEKYFDSLPDTMRTFQVYGALLNCYAHHKCLEKEEATVQIMRESRLLRKHDKLDVLVQEMKEKGMKHNLNAYAFSSDIEGMEKFLTTIENNVEVSVDWHAYVAAASAYLKARLAEKALEMLITQASRKHASERFLTLYTNLGRKDDRLYGNLGKFFNSTYTVSLIKRGVIKEPDEFILNSLATGYQMDGHMSKPVETMKAAILSGSSGWKPNFCAVCLKFLEGEDNLEAAKELLQLLQVKDKRSSKTLDEGSTRTHEGQIEANS